MSDVIELFENKEDCFGCMACVSVCAQGAIEVIRDEQGFDYPQINREKCINCGMCKKACQI